MPALNIFPEAHERSNYCSEVVFWVWVQLDHLGIFVLLKEVGNLFLLEFGGLGVFPSRGHSQTLCVDDAEDIEANDHAAEEDPVHCYFNYIFL